MKRRNEPGPFRDNVKSLKFLIGPLALAACALAISVTLPLVRTFRVLDFATIISALAWIANVAFTSHAWFRMSILSTYLQTDESKRRQAASGQWSRAAALAMVLSMTAVAIELLLHS